MKQATDSRLARLTAAAANLGLTFAPAPVANDAHPYRIRCGKDDAHMLLAGSLEECEAFLRGAGIVSERLWNYGAGRPNPINPNLSDEAKRRTWSA